MGETAFVLIVEDEAEHAEALADGLRREGHACRVVHSGDEALDSIRARRPDVIVVDEEFSRKGVGGKLLAFMEEFIIKKGARRIYVDTSSTPPYEPARAFYEKHGYRLAGLLEDFYRKGDHKVIFMKEVTGSV